MLRRSISLTLGLLALCAAPAFAEEAAAVPAEADTEAVTTPVEEADPSRLRLGVVFAGNLTNVAFRESANNFGNRFGYGAGVRGVFTLAEHLHLMPELLYVQRGMSGQVVDIGFVPGDEDEEQIGRRAVYNFHYLQVPLFARYDFLSGESLAFYGAAGPTVSVFLNRTRTTSEGTFDTVTDNVNRVHFGTGVGVGAELNMNVGTGTVELRYDRGLTSFINYGEELDERVVHWAVSLMVGFHYQL